MLQLSGRLLMVVLKYQFGSPVIPALQYILMTPPEECTSIDEIRNAIDTLDRTIIAALGQRFGYVKAITRFKRTPEDVAAPARYQHVLTTRRTWAEEAGLSPDAIERMYRDLIAYFIDEEMKLLKNRDE